MPRVEHESRTGEMVTRVFGSFDELREAAGEHLGRSAWRAVDQHAIDAFAEVTGDHQWIHVDRERAASGPYGATIAHGYLVLSMIPTLMREVLRVDARSMGLNYGLDRVRFISPVRVDARIRAAVELRSVSDVAGGVQGYFTVVLELEGSEKPACVAGPIIRYLS